MRTEALADAMCMLPARGQGQRCSLQGREAAGRLGPRPAPPWPSLSMWLRFLCDVFPPALSSQWPHLDHTEDTMHEFLMATWTLLLASQPVPQSAEH